MSWTQLEYVDLRDLSTRQIYMDDAPAPIEWSPLPDVPSEDPMTPPPLPRTRQPRQPRSDKWPRVKATLQQKLGLKVEFEKNGDALSDVQPSTQFGIPLKNAQRLLTELWKGSSTLPKGHFGKKNSPSVPTPCEAYD